jgi:hypothetical protein
LVARSLALMRRKGEVGEQDLVVHDLVLDAHAPRAQRA